MDKIEMLEKEIVETLPQISYVIDQVGDAIKWAKEVLDADAIRPCLEKAVKVSKYAAKISEANFYKTHLVIASILADMSGKFEDITAEKEFERFDSASKAVVNTLKALTINKETIMERGCFKALIMHLTPLAKSNPDAFVIMMYGILADLQQISSGMEKVDEKSPITQNDYITVLGYALLVNNLYNSNLHLLEEAQILLNSVQIELNKFNY